MSGTIIRLGGSHAGNTKSVKNLISFLHRQEGPKFIVCSAFPEMLRFIRFSVGEVVNRNENSFSGKLLSFYSELTGNSPGSSYSALVDQVSGIIRGIGLLGDYSEALKDQVVSFAEKLTVDIFEEQFDKMGLKTKILLPEQFEFVATADYGNATFISVNTEKISELQNQVYLIPGSYGITGTGKIARAGKTAADYSAAFLARELSCKSLVLWGLDLDFFRADPSILPGSPRIKRLTYSEASELAYFDHISFHPRTVEPLESEHIPIYVVNPETGDGIVDTLINTETFVENQVVKSVACTDDISLIRLNGPGVGMKPGILAKVTSQLNLAGINIKSVITSQISINLILERNTGKKAFELINLLGFSSVRDISLIDDVSLVGVVGHGMQHNCGVSAKIFGAVAKSNINVVLSGSGASDLVSYLVVKTIDKENSVREIYNAFFA